MGTLLPSKATDSLNCLSQWVVEGLVAGYRIPRRQMACPVCLPMRTLLPSRATEVPNSPVPAWVVESPQQVAGHDVEQIRLSGSVRMAECADEHVVAVEGHRRAKNVIRCRVGC